MYTFLTHLCFFYIVKTEGAGSMNGLLWGIFYYHSLFLLFFLTKSLYLIPNGYMWDFWGITASFLAFGVSLYVFIKGKRSFLVLWLLFAGFITTLYFIIGLSIGSI